MSLNIFTKNNQSWFSLKSSSFDIRFFLFCFFNIRIKVRMRKILDLSPGEMIEIYLMFLILLMTPPKKSPKQNDPPHKPHTSTNNKNKSFHGYRQSVSEPPSDQIQHYYLMLWKSCNFNQNLHSKATNCKSNSL